MTPARLPAAVFVTAATIEDARAVAQVHVLSWQQAYRDLLPQTFLDALSVEERAVMWRECIAHGSPQVMVAKSAGQVCGFAAFGPSRDQDAPAGTAEIMALYLAPDVWSTGVGRRLWCAVLERVVAQGFAVVTLWVMAHNARAIRFYEAAGFEAQPSSRKQFTLGGLVLDEVRYQRRAQHLAADPKE